MAEKLIPHFLKDLFSSKESKTIREMEERLHTMNNEEMLDSLRDYADKRFFTYDPVLLGEKKNKPDVFWYISEKQIPSNQGQWEHVEGDALTQYLKNPRTGEIIQGISFLLSYDEYLKAVNIMNEWADSLPKETDPSNIA